MCRAVRCGAARAALGYTARAVTDAAAMPTLPGRTRGPRGASTLAITT
jgi:hypothetical protein